MTSTGKRRLIDAGGNPIPMLILLEAEAVGQQLHDQFQTMGITPPLKRDDMGWADLVQFVLRQSSAAMRDRNTGDDE